MLYKLPACLLDHQCHTNTLQRTLSFHQNVMQYSNILSIMPLSFRTMPHCNLHNPIKTEETRKSYCSKVLKQTESEPCAPNDMIFSLATEIRALWI
jgi:hypothetical protein